tara:strand:+ start:565 stop:924 length:360 start_codon:yes stop_codon:yes gene_type:complete
MANYQPDSERTIENAFGGTSIGQQPIERDGKAFFSYASCPPEQTIVKRPSHIIINQPGTYAFAYQSSSVVAYETGSLIVGDADRGNPAVKLDINPVAWAQVDGTAGTVGDITFVYKRSR